MEVERIIILMLLVLGIGTICKAQDHASASDQCKVHYKIVYKNANLPGGYMDGFPEKGEKDWAAKDALKKYPNACYDPAKADYAIVWTVGRVDDGDATIINNGKYSTVIGGAYSFYSVYVAKLGPNGEIQPPALTFYNHNRRGHEIEPAVKFLNEVKHE